MEICHSNHKSRVKIYIYPNLKTSGTVDMGKHISRYLMFIYGTLKYVPTTN